MIENARHVPLHPTPWDAGIATVAIDEIVSDALTHFDEEGFWPAHPQDNAKDGHSGFYMGAAGMIWGIDYLQRVGATAPRIDFRPVLARLLATTQAEMAGYGDYSTNGSFLFGDLGTALVVMRLAPSGAIADLIHERAAINLQLPVRELMWGMPGSMLACVHILGPVHGYAGNMIPLIRGWKWLTDDQRAQVSHATTRTLVANAWRCEHGVSWPAVAGQEKSPYLCQHCHGAPGMVTTFADAPFTSADLERLLVEGGDFTWTAGPLAKGSNLCHGTGGNGYAFLKLHRRTGSPLWLERARAFAMTAIAQCRETRAELGRGRYSLWTGDIGLAVYLWDCLKAEPRFPTVDVF